MLCLCVVDAHSDPKVFLFSVHLETWICFPACSLFPPATRLSTGQLQSLEEAKPLKALDPRISRPSL